MLEEKIQIKRKQLNESIEKNNNYADVYRLSVELDDLIAEFYKESKEKERTKNILKPVRLKKILYIAWVFRLEILFFLTKQNKISRIYKR